jgi:hypothetical protein
MPRVQTFGNSAIQLTFFQEDNYSIPPWTISVLSATFHHEHAMSLTFGKKISYSHQCIGKAIYNLIFTNLSDHCHKHIIDCPPDARTTILTLRRHCAPLTQDHVELTHNAFCSIKQGHHMLEPHSNTNARLLSHRNPKNDTEIMKRAIRGGSNHLFFAASYQQFNADIRQAELNDEELESHLLKIDKSCGLTLPSQNQRNCNQHAKSACPSFLTHTLQPCQGTTHIFTSCQQEAFSSTMQPYTSNNNRPPQQPNLQPNNPFSAQLRPNNNNDCRPTTHQARPSQQQNCGARPPFRPISSNNTNQRHAPNNNNAARQNPNCMQQLWKTRPLC